MRTRPRALLRALLPLLLLLPAALAAQLPAELAARIDAVAERALGEGPGAGLSIAVARGGEVVYARGYGYANLEHAVPATPETVYRIGSVTKQFAAVAILQLVEQGKLRLDDELSSLLPEVPTRGRRVTVEQLLNHTSGIRSYTGLGEAWRLNQRLDLTDAELVALFRDEPFDFEPGTRYLYNNSAYYLIGMIVERVSGQPFERYLHEAILEPLGLSSTSYCRNRPILRGRASGYDVVDGALVNAGYISMNVPGAAGAMCSTVHDLVRWTHALAGHRALGPDAYRRMTTPGRLADGSELDYGYGLRISTHAGRRTIGHGGSINGFRSMLTHYPDDDLIVVVLSNTGGGVDPGWVAEAVVGALLGG